MSGILCDSDFLISLFIDKESTYPEAVRIYKLHRSKEIFVLRIILYEIATVVGRKYGHEEAHRILQILHSDSIKKIDITEYEFDVWAEYFLHKKRHVSFFDCANIVAAKKYGFKIASFDAFYPKQLRAL